MPRESLEPITDLPEGLDGLVVLFDYRGPDRDLVLGLKHNRGMGALPSLADRTARAVGAEPWSGRPALVTWVPTTPTRRRERGYDQSLLLAKAVARRLGLPRRPLLQRRGHAQEGLDGAARRAGPQLSARHSVTVPVLLIDDVVTTGATLSAAAAALRSAGAPEVYGAALAISRAPA